MLVIRGQNIINAQREIIHLRGIALGGWLMLEGYMLGGENIAESIFKDTLKREAGDELAADFTFEFRNRFIPQNDFKIIKYLGFNCVRLRFNYRLL